MEMNLGKIQPRGLSRGGGSQLTQGIRIFFCGVRMPRIILEAFTVSSHGHEAKWKPPAHVLLNA